MLSASSLFFSFVAARPVLKGLSLCVPEGQSVSLVGASGAGKTTLFRILMGALKAGSGSVSARTDEIAYMRQEDLLLPWLPVHKNLLLFSKASKESALELLEKVGLRGYENHFPSQLSGGQRQRVALARTLLQNRPILLLDEPFGSLDVMIREELYEILRELKGKKTLLFVTHDFRDALALSERVLVMGNGVIAADFEREDPETLTDKIRSTLKECRAEMVRSPQKA